jgi:hypothetical protein
MSQSQHASNALGDFGDVGDTGLPESESMPVAVPNCSLVMSEGAAWGKEFVSGSSCIRADGQQHVSMKACKRTAAPENVVEEAHRGKAPLRKQIRNGTCALQVFTGPCGSTDRFAGKGATLNQFGCLIQVLFVGN